MKYITLILTLVISTSIHGQSNSNDPTEALLKRFLLTFETEGHRKAFTELFNTNSYMTPAMVDTVAADLELYLPQLGKYQGAERINKSIYGQGLTVYTYFLKYDRQPIRFFFRFYKAKDTWVFLNLNYNVSFTEDLKEELKPLQNKK